MIDRRMLKNTLYPIGAIGNSLSKHIYYLLNLIAFCAYLIRISWTFKNNEKWRVYQGFIHQIYETGIKNLFIFTIMGLLIGMFAILQIQHQITKAIGLGNLGGALNSVIIRELSAFVPAIFVILSSGVSITSELGYMTVLGKADVLRNALPKFWALVFCIPFLVIYFDITSLLGGYLLANSITEIPFPVFLDSLTHAISASDFVVSLLKAVIFALTIATISIYQGLQTKEPTEISHLVSCTAIHSLFYCFILDITIFITCYLPG